MFCIEASRLARNGRDWHHLIDLCTLVVGLDGTYAPRYGNNRLPLGVPGSEVADRLRLRQRLNSRFLAATPGQCARSRDEGVRVAKLVWRVKLMAELRPGVVTEPRPHALSAARGRAWPDSGCGWTKRSS